MPGEDLDLRPVVYHRAQWSSEAIGSLNHPLERMQILTSRSMTGTSIEYPDHRCERSARRQPKEHGRGGDRDLEVV